MENGSELIVALQKLRCYKGLMNTQSIQSLSDEHLLRELEAAVVRERGATTQVIALLAEMDTRRLYLQQGYSSLFTYCTGWLHLSEHAAYGRIEAARAARKFPAVLDRLADGSITLTAICLLSNHLSSENHQQLLEAAKHKTRREVEEQIAALHPKTAVPSTIRKLPQPKARVTTGVALDVTREVALGPITGQVTGANKLESSFVPTPAPPVIRSLSPERYRVQFTIGVETQERLRRLQNLMRHTVPNGDIAEIFDRALTLLLREVERQKLAQVDQPRRAGLAKTGGRCVRAAVRREVWERDRGQCAFVGAKGRCEERGFLEFHHVIPFAQGGETTTENLELRCRAHNAYEAREYFGSSLLRERIESCADSFRRQLMTGPVQGDWRDAFPQQPDAAWNLERQHRHPHQHRERRAQQSAELQR